VRAWVRLPSGRRLDLLAPTPFDWTDADLALGLARTYRWGGHSIWPGAPLSVAQHSLAVWALRRARAPTGLSRPDQRRELLHDAEEGLLGFDCISPLKPFLGEAFAALEARLRGAVGLGADPCKPRVNKITSKTAGYLFSNNKKASKSGFSEKPLTS
jgi:hypothetical protein